MLVDYLAMTWYPIEYLKVSGSSDLADFNSKEYAKSIISNFNWKPWGEWLGYSVRGHYNGGQSENILGN